MLIHGFPDSSSLWRHQVGALVDAGYRTIAPDLRGFGDSDRPAEVGAYGVRHSVADMLAVLDALEVERAHVVAHDWGAAVGWALAGFAGERVGRFAVLSVGHPNALRRPTIEQRERSWYPLLFQFEGTAEQLLMHDDWRLFREWTRGDGDTEHAIADLARPGALTAALNWYRASWRPDAELRERRPFPSVAADTLGPGSDGDHYLVEEQDDAGEYDGRGATSGSRARATAARRAGARERAAARVVQPGLTIHFRAGPPRSASATGSSSSPIGPAASARQSTAPSAKAARARGSTSAGEWWKAPRRSSSS